MWARQSANRRSNGWSLIEAMTVIAIISILAALAIPSFAKLSARRLVEGHAEELRNALMAARSEAVTRNTPVLISFQSTRTPACYVMQTGKAGDCTCLVDPVAHCKNGAVEIKTVLMPSDGSLGLDANLRAVSFNPTRGTASPGTITLAARYNQEINLVVNKTGRVRSCANKEDIPGLKSCKAASP